MSTQSGIPATAVERGKVAPVKFAHIVYRTSRFAEMVEWYKTTLEAEVMMENEMFLEVNVGIGATSPQKKVDTLPAVGSVWPMFQRMSSSRIQ